MRLLRAFYFAGKHSSFKAAAERLALTPSAVSHQVKELEEQLGVTLFQHLNTKIQYEFFDNDEVDDAYALWLTGAWRF